MCPLSNSTFPFVPRIAQHQYRRFIFALNVNATFRLRNNPGGACTHAGTWHSEYDHCSYLKCGFYLGKKGSIGEQHWSCCYSLDRPSNTCQKSDPHTFIKPV